MSKNIIFIKNELKNKALRYIRQMEEQWKKIINYEENYSVSNFGNVKNNKTERILKPRPIPKGYLQVVLCKNGKRKTLYVHRLVGGCFIENFDDKIQIDHIDRNTKNNNISNLRNVSNGENQRNKSKKANCSSVYKGVCFDKCCKKWKAAASDNGKNIHLGYFETELEASEKYQSWNKEKGYIV